MLNLQSKLLMAALVASAALAGTTTQTDAALIINEVYPGGGSNTSAAYKQDYVEIYNTGDTAVDLTGYQIQYSAASAGSVFGNVIFNFGAGSYIGAGDYITINSGAAGTAGVVNANANGSNTTVGLSASSGAVRLIDASSSVVDLVGYGTIPASTSTPPTVKYETAPASSPTSNLYALARTSFVDSGDNSKDFTSVTPNPIMGTNSLAVAAAPVPEPASLGLLALGGAALLTRRRK